MKFSNSNWLIQPNTKKLVPMEFLEFTEYTRIVFNRISKIDPENARKIIGFLLLRDHSDQEMAQLALGPDHHILEILHQVKAELHLLALRSMSAPSSSSGIVPFALSRNRHFPSSSSNWDQQLANKRMPLGYSDGLYEFQNSSPYFGLDDLMEPPNSGLSGFDCSYVDNAVMVNNLSARTAPRHYLTGPEFHPKICHYYAKGHCKHGNSCRYLHSSPMSESYSPLYNGNCSNDDHLFQPGSLEKLEFEIVDLLKSRRGNPISTAALPMIYAEKYGRNLQAEGYLTESQRHGKSGYSLTKLLARLKSIQVIDRPHGQHSVILTEDASKFMDHRTEKNDSGMAVSSARQIYLTFPAESTFTEDDVSEYFSARYGMVEDVRIPCQQRRMFGFVTFHSVETVNQILSQDNEHLICGARVLVKPYREKSKLERKNLDRIEQHQTYCTHYNNLESEQLHSIPRGFEASRMLRRIEEQQQQQALEIERRLSEMSLKAKSVISRPYFNYQMKELEVPEEHFSFPIAERLDHMLDALKTGSASGCGTGSGSGSGSMTVDNNQPQNSNDWKLTNLNSEGYNLPESI